MLDLLLMLLAYAGLILIDNIAARIRGGPAASVGLRPK